MAFLAPNGYGTDTRAQAQLVGAAIAIGLTLWKDGSGRRWFTRLASVLASVLALAGVAGTAALWATTAESSTFAFSGGFMVASLAAGEVVGQRLAPELVALGEAHANASPGGGWPGPLPPSTPSWFSNLPCQ
jgi:hypothetical protein